MKICIYLGNNIGSEVDACHIEDGNPGIGGAHYCMLMLGHFLSMQKDFEVTYISIRKYITPPKIKVIYVADESEVVSVAMSVNPDFFILKQFPGSILEEDIRNSNLKVIVWSHNFLSSKFCKYIAKTPQIKCNVFVGKQQYDAYIDDDVIKKSTYIFNMVTSKDYVDDVLHFENPTVVFVGAICAKKGFLEMCKIWPGIVRDVPNAKLIVIGSGDLYQNIKLGKYGIAAQGYENRFVPYITDNMGNIIPSIDFKGILGSEKNDIFRSADIGVVNPSGSRETFGMAIVEMAKMGLPVATIGTTGYYDTVNNGESGILAKDLKQLQKQIIYMLQNKEIAKNRGGYAKLLANRFLPTRILPIWIDLFNKLQTGNYNFKTFSSSKPYSNNNKWLRVILKFLRFKLGLKIIPSSVMLEGFIKNMLQTGYALSHRR